MIQVSANSHEAKVFKAHAAPKGLCDNLINALELLTNQQKDGDSPIDSIVTGVREKSRTGIVKALKNFIEEDNHNGVDVGCLRRGTRSIRLTKPQFSDAYPEAVIREGADELTLRAEDVWAR